MTVELVSLAIDFNVWHCVFISKYMCSTDNLGDCYLQILNPVQIDEEIQQPPPLFPCQDAENLSRSR